ncbi:ABC transporter permease [Aureimonas populi]|uniref:ABC transporter permease n=1 Tax=Aureimonas populi TaxID=1701758 RepID=A0ABW5CJ19_9HYPH|nr:ABC transporter permease [Aureimonas populi]
MKRVASTLLAVAFLILCWEVAHRSLGLAALPGPFTALAQLPVILGEPSSLNDIFQSLRRMAIGYGLAAVFGICVGLMMGRSAVFAHLLNPLLMTIYPVPKGALMPILMIWLGVGDMSKILVIFLGVSLPVIFHSMQGARSVNEVVVWSAAAMGMGRGGQLLRVVLPSALPEIFIGLRTGLVLALITMVTSEIVARTDGIGNLLFNSLDMALYDRMFGAIVLIAAMGYFLDLGFDRVRAFFLSWSPAQQSLGASGG